MPIYRTPKYETQIISRVGRKFDNMFRGVKVFAEKITYR
jgi:hypothetical protein